MKQKIKVVVLKETPEVGKTGEVIEVTQGFAKNYLFPQQLAIPATADALHRAEKLRMKRERDEEQKKTRAVHVAEQLAKTTVTIKRKVNEKGKLYAGVGPKDIVEALEQAGFKEIRPEAIRVDKAITMPGEHTVKVLLSGDLSTNLKTNVQPEEESEG